MNLLKMSLIYFYLIIFNKKNVHVIDYVIQQYVSNFYLQKINWFLKMHFIINFSITNLIVKLEMNTL